MNNGYSICLNEWALDKGIKNELGILLIISSLCAEKGYCYASNKYLAELFKTDEIQISRKIKKLEEKKYITIEYEKRGFEVITRKIRLTKMLMDDKQNCKSTINKNVKDNNISNNNTINNKKEKIIKKEKYFENDDLNDLFIDFLEMRKKLKAVNSERAINMLINKLNEYNDEIKIEMINNAIVNSWKSVFPLREDKLKQINEKLKKEESKKILYSDGVYYSNSDRLVVGKVGKMDVSNYEVRTQ